MSTEIVEIENPSRRRLYRYFTAISKLRLGILTEQGGGSQELVPFLGRRPFFLSLFKFQLTCKFKLFFSSYLFCFGLDCLATSRRGVCVTARSLPSHAVAPSLSSEALFIGRRGTHN